MDGESAGGNFSSDWRGIDAVANGRATGGEGAAVGDRHSCDIFCADRSASDFFHLVSDHESAIAGVDYIATNGALSFADGETVKSFTIPITEDSLDEHNETVLA